MCFTREKDGAAARNEADDDGRKAVRAGWRLFALRFFRRLRAFMIPCGMALLVLVTAGVFFAAAYAEPSLFGAVRGEYRAQIILVFGGGCAAVLAGLFFAYLLPRAVMAAYEDYALSCFGAPRRGMTAGEDEKSAFLRIKGVYWWALLVRLVTGAALGLCAWAAARWIAGRFSAQSWSIAVVWAVAAVLFWQGRYPLSLALAAAARERVSGLAALRRGQRLYRRALNAASLAGFITLCTTMLLVVFALVISAWIAQGHALARLSIAALLTALLYPPLRLLIAAFDTAVYAAARRGSFGISRRTIRVRGVRKTSDVQKTAFEEKAEFKNSEIREIAKNEREESI